MLFGQLRTLFHLYYTHLHEKFDKICLETTFLYINKKLRDKVMFNILLLKIYCHLLCCCRGFNSVNECFYCSRFCVNNENISHKLDKKFSFNRSFFRDFISRDSFSYYPEKIT